MDKLGSLESSLPPEQPPTSKVIAALSSELSQEFKVAANAVTKLYRVANEKNSLLKHHSYVACLDDILALISRNPQISAQDLQLWCLKQRGDRLATTDTSKEPSGSKYDFDFSSQEKHTSATPKFVLSMPPLSVEHTHKPKWHTRAKKVKHSQATEPPPPRSSSSSSSSIHSDPEDILLEDVCKLKKHKKDP